ncbi:MAG: integrase core domain-containing protein [Planctomycetota bacterium]
MAPSANAFVESWVASIKRECLSHFVCFSRSHLDHIAGVYFRFYNEHRPHQGLGNRTLSFEREEEQLAEMNHLASIGSIGCQSELGGLCASQKFIRSSGHGKPPRNTRRLMKQ